MTVISFCWRLKDTMSKREDTGSAACERLDNVKNPVTRLQRPVGR
jgi:hypothetical protein